MQIRHHSGRVPKLNVGVLACLMDVKYMKGAPFSDRPGLESQLKLGNFAVPQRLVAPGEAASVDLFGVTALL